MDNLVRVSIIYHEKWDRTVLGYTTTNQQDIMDLTEILVEKDNKNGYTVVKKFEVIVMGADSNLYQKVMLGLKEDGYELIKVTRKFDEMIKVIKRDVKL